MTDNDEPGATGGNGPGLTSQITTRPRLSRNALRQVALGDSYSGRAARLRAQWAFWWTDHAWIRVLWHNQAEIAPGVWRSNQPSPARIAKLADLGIRRILSLRGFAKSAHHTLEANTCRHFGITLDSMHLSATQLPPAQRLLDLLDRFERYDRPFLFHCKSGADRAGLAAALYLLHIEQAPIDQARRQLSLNFVHVRRFRTGILDYFLDVYARDNAARPQGVRDWIETRYDRDRITADYLDRRRRGIY